MEISGLSALISLSAAVSGIILGWWARARTVKKDAIKDAAGEIMIRQDVKYIKQGVDEIKAELRSQKTEIVSLSERVIRTEESTKQAHKRIDCLSAAVK